MTGQLLIIIVESLAIVGFIGWVAALKDIIAEHKNQVAKDRVKARVKVLGW